jgi:hypothetical protein
MVYSLEEQYVQGTRVSPPYMMYIYTVLISVLPVASIARKTDYGKTVYCPARNILRYRQYEKTKLLDCGRRVEWYTGCETRRSSVRGRQT